jgi:hypothetical protein
VKSSANVVETELSTIRGRPRHGFRSGPIHQLPITDFHLPIFNVSGRTRHGESAPRVIVQLLKIENVMSLRSVENL